MLSPPPDSRISHGNRGRFNDRYLTGTIYRAGYLSRLKRLKTRRHFYQFFHFLIYICVMSQAFNVIFSIVTEYGFLCLVIFPMIKFESKVVKYSVMALILCQYLYWYCRFV